MTMIRRGVFAVIAALGCAARVNIPVKTPGIAPSSILVDDRYYDFWPGAWYELRDSVRDSVPTFVVRRGVNPAVFEEEWRLVIDSGRVSRSVGLRAWDQTYGKWMFVWVSDLRHFQIWEVSGSGITGTFSARSSRAASAFFRGRRGSREVRTASYVSWSGRSTTGARGSRARGSPISAASHEPTVSPHERGALAG